MGPQTTIQNPRTALKLLATTLLLLVGYQIITSPGFDALQLGTADILSFWAGARLFLQGDNPYDYQLLINEAALATGRPNPGVGDIWIPPWVFGAIWPFGLVSFDIIRPLWLIISILIFAICLKLFSLTTTDRSKQPAWVFSPPDLVFLSLFYPFLLTIWLGQINPFIVIGLFLFLWLRCQNFPLASIAAGVALSLLLIKPHLLFLVLLAVLVEGVVTRSLKVWLGVVIGFLTLNIPAFIFRPEIWNAYYARPTLNHLLSWMTPTLSYLLAYSVGENTLLIRFLPLILAAVVLSLVAFRTVRAQNELSLDVLVSCVGWSLCVTLYSWTYDFVLLLPVALRLLQITRQYSFVYYSVILLLLTTMNITMLLLPYDMFFSFWYPTCLMILYSFVLVIKLRQPSKV
jgi:hypothetical protein